MSDRVAVVTGGAGAIGGAIVERLAEDHVVVIVDRDGEFAADLSREQAVRDVARRILDVHARVDVLVHAAAVFDRATIEDVDVAMWRHVQAVNVESVLLLGQAFVPGMRQRRFGRIVNIVSNTFWSPPAPNFLPYITSKGALVGMTRSLAQALGPDGISVTAVAPGLTRTPASTQAAPPEEFADTLARQALARALVPEDVASTVAFLVRDQAAAFTGQTLVPDGGIVMR
jgi:NAD(P)-dependent dehydrogenase (short-subunit alcohol dehydrogenase family)